MSKNFTEFTEKQSGITGNDHLVGYDGVILGGEKKYKLSTISSAVSSLMTPSLSGDAWLVSKGTNKARSLANRFADVVNVKDFGAVGDGVTDDTAALNRAASYSGMVYFSKGIYTTTTGVRLTYGCKWIGEGNYSGVARPNTNDGNAIIKYTGVGGTNSCVVAIAAEPIGIEPLNPATSNMQNVGFSNFLIDGNYAAEFGLYTVRAWSNNKLDYVTVKGTLKHAFYAAACWNGTILNWMAVRNSGCGITLGKNIWGWTNTTVDESSLHSFFGYINGVNADVQYLNQFNESTNTEAEYGIGVYESRVLTFINAQAAKCGGVGIYINNSNGFPTKFIGSYVEFDGQSSGSTKNWDIWIKTSVGSRNISFDAARIGTDGCIKIDGVAPTRKTEGIEFKNIPYVKEINASHTNWNWVNSFQGCTFSGAGAVPQSPISSMGGFVGDVSDSTSLATGSTTARTLANRFADVVNVLDFGAVSDYYLAGGSINPTPTDNTVAFQNAVNYASTLLTPSTEINYPVVKGAVYIPSGAYYIASGSSITLQKGVCIFGESRSSSQIIHGGGNVPCITTVDYTSDPNNTNVQIQVEKLFILGSGASTTYGIKIYDSYRNSDVREVTVKNCNVGLYAKDSYTLFVDRCDFQFAITDSIQIYNPTAISVFNTRIDNSGRYGIYLDGTTNNQGVHAIINNCQIQRGQKSGIQSIDVASLNVKDCYFEGNNRDSSSSSDIAYLNGIGNRCVNCIIDGVFATCATGGTNNRFITSDATLTLVGSRNFDSVSDPAIYTYGVYLNSGVDKFVSINNILVATTDKIFRASANTNIYDDSNVNCYIPNSKFGLREIGGGIELKLTSPTNKKSSIVLGDISDEAQAGFYYDPLTSILSFNGYDNSERLQLKKQGQLKFATLASEPIINVTAGDVYYNTTTKTLRLYNGTNWYNLTMTIV